MYRQMNTTDLIANNTHEFVSKSLQLMVDDSFYKTTRDRLRMGFQNDLFKNLQVAMEWASFLKRISS
jgi:predicted O-linked N-acetylglucosamine transferase (SPINDLY family)